MDKLKNWLKLDSVMFLRYGKDQMRALDTEECVLCHNVSKYLPTHLIRPKKCKKSRLPREIPPRTVGKEAPLKDGLRKMQYGSLLVVC